MRKLLAVVVFLIGFNAFGKSERYIKVNLKNEHIVTSYMGLLKQSFEDRYDRLEGRELVAISYNLINDGKDLGEVNLVGNAQNVGSDVKLNVTLNIDELYSRLQSEIPADRLALLLVDGNKIQGKDLKKEFNNLLKDGFIIFPEFLKREDLGQNLISCTCKGMFGGTACCTSPSCNVRLGICQRNDACKQNGSCPEYTSCACRKN